MTLENREFYDAKAAQLGAPTAEAVLRCCRAVALAELAPGMAVLDLGCGGGVLHDVLVAAHPAAAYVGIDLSFAPCCRTGDAARRRFLVADVTAGLPLSSGRFARAFLLEVLEHVENPTWCLLEVRRVLEPGGLVVASVPNPYCWNEIVGNLRGGVEGEGHISSWTPQTFVTMARRSGFSVRRRRGTCWRLPLSRRILRDRYAILPANALFLARSLIYVLTPEE